MPTQFCIHHSGGRDHLVDKYVHLKMNAGTKMFVAMIFIFSFCKACQSAATRTENDLVATSSPTTIPLPTSTVAVDSKDTTSEETVAPVSVTQVEALYILRGNVGMLIPGKS